MSLKDRLIRLILADGPLPVSAFMQACLHDPDAGYYATRPGVARDFITAPEASQIFGELIGLWAVHEWRALGAPDPFALVELGPGRGTLMSDALRAAAGVSEYTRALHLELVETSQPLKAIQAERLSKYAPTFRTSLNDVPQGPAIILANEFLDCLPARQFVSDGGAWRERVVGVGADEALVFGLSVDRRHSELASAGGASHEVQPGLEPLIADLSVRSEAGARFRALFIDYGEAERAPADTLRAYRNGVQEDPLANPGLADLTVDVDFGRLGRLARRAGLDVAGPVEQGPFLIGLGAQARLDALVAATPDAAEATYAGARKLVDPAEMGARFKVICLSSPGLPAPAGFG